MTAKWNYFWSGVLLGLTPMQVAEGAWGLVAFNIIVTGLNILVAKAQEAK